jgi:hypothetical protein
VLIVRWLLNPNEEKYRWANLLLTTDNAILRMGEELFRPENPRK